MTLDDVADFMLKHRRDMPLTDNREHLKRYIALNDQDDTIRIITDWNRIGGVCLWKLTNAKRGELGVWDHSVPGGNILVVHHIVAINPRIVGRLAGYLLKRYPGAREVWSERRGKKHRFSRQFLERIAHGKRSRST